MRLLKSTTWAQLILLLLPYVSIADEKVTLIGARTVDVDGTIHSIGGNLVSKPVVVLFLDSGCPISRKYTATLNELYLLAQKKNIEFYGVFSNPSISAVEVKMFHEEFSLDFPVIYDGSGDLANRLQPKVTPEAFLVSSDDKVLYRGRIDNWFAAIGKQRTKITSHDLKDALLSVAKNKKPKSSYAEPVGCIAPDWENPKNNKPEVTYAKDVSQILNANCVECHRIGEVAPFSLETYKDAKRWAKMISHVTAEGIMPPWNAEQGFGKFKDERVLSEHQVTLLKKWADSGAPEGENTNQIAKPKFNNNKWKLGKPDKVIKVMEPYNLPASGEDVYRYFVIPSNFGQDKVVKGIEFHPGDPSVVHHALVYMDYTGRALKEDKKDPESGFSLFGNRNFMNTGAYPLVGWSPGRKPFKLQDGLGMWVPRGGDVVIEVHYHLSGKATQDQSEVGFYFADRYPTQWIDGFVIGTQKISIPPNDSNYQRHFYMNVPADLNILDITPHMHYLGKSVLAQATLPDGSIVPLIKIEDWDFRWQNTYTYREPVRIPAGSRIDAWYSYDNSMTNPANPNLIASTVRWGPQSNNEMAQLWMTVLPDQIGLRSDYIRASRVSYFRNPDPSAANYSDNPFNKLNTRTSVLKLRDKNPFDSNDYHIYDQVLDSSKFNGIVKEFGTYLNQNHNDVEALTTYGYLLFARSNFALNSNELRSSILKSKAAYEKALQTDPKHWRARMGLAMLYQFSPVEMNFTQDGIELLEELILFQESEQIKPEYFFAYISLSYMYEQLGKLDKAREVRRQGSKYFPDYPFFYEPAKTAQELTVNDNY